MQVRIKKIDPKATVPTYGSEFSAGADLYACAEEATLIPAGETRMIHTGLAFEIPEGYVGLIYARSSLGTKRGLAPANKVGVMLRLEHHANSLIVFVFSPLKCREERSVSCL